MHRSDVYGDEPVVGVNYDNRQAVVGTLQPGQELLLRLEPDNPYNANAIRVDTLDQRQVGYLKDARANELAARFKRYGGPVNAVVVAVVGGGPDKPSLGVRIRFELPLDEQVEHKIQMSGTLDDSYRKLTAEQRTVVEHPLNSHARVLAVAGSGKTTTMVYRIKYLVESRGIQPSNICVLMFNARAREQFKNKLNEIIEVPALRPANVHTFHSFSYKILKEAGKSGLRSDTEESWIEDKEEVGLIWMRNAIDRLEKEGKIEPHSVELDDAMNCVGLWKGALIPPNRAGHRTNPAMSKVYAAFEQLRQSNNGVTFDDYVPEAVRLLSSQSELSSRYHNRFRIVIVDEYQDVNYGQQKLVELLAGNHADVMVVGDDDQTIYEWRGARPEYLAKRFGDTVFGNRRMIPYTLSNTFRFGPVLAQCAQNAISNNHAREPKSLAAFDPAQESGMTIFVNNSEQTTDTNKELVRTVKMCLRETKDPRQVTVLARLYSQFAGLEIEFLKEKIPYRVHGRKPFLERTEVTTLLDYLRLGVNYHQLLTPKSLEWIRNTLNRPNRKLPRDRIASYAETMQPVTVAQLLTAVAHDKWASPLNDKLRGVATEYETAISGLHERMSGPGPVPAGKLLRWLVGAVGYTKHYDNFYGPGESSEDRKQAVAAFLDFADHTGMDAEEFLQYVKGLNPGQGQPEEKQILMTTIFRVKGEEFQYVVLPECIEGSMPSTFFASNPTFDTAGIVAEPLPSDDLENERRLFYVGITRARKGVFIGTSAPPAFGQQGAAQLVQPSRFLEEMEYEAVQEVLGALQRCASSNFCDLSRLSAAALKHASNKRIVQTVTNVYLPKSVRLPDDVEAHIANTSPASFTYQRTYTRGNAAAPNGNAATSASSIREWWEEDD
jgi:DNA helicase-2/ATP-dependent DNA helicase PcrA